MQYLQLGNGHKNRRTFFVYFDLNLERDRLRGHTIVDE